jgi:hypothetical protein
MNYVKKDINKRLAKVNKQLDRLLNDEDVE